ncbi:MAG TPA: zinc ribbon domain-containing protein [Desulfomonilia bacterium]
MPTYDYICKSCGNKFEVFRPMSDKSPVECGMCRGEAVKAPATTGGIIMNKGSSCSYESTGTTCCGAKQRCGKDSCGR